MVDETNERGPWLPAWVRTLPLWAREHPRLKEVIAHMALRDTLTSNARSELCAHLRYLDGGGKFTEPDIDF